MPANSIYLDHAATTPLLPAARAAMLAGFEIWANPSSPHGSGRGAREVLENARERVRTALNWDGEVIFTSGASEALAIGLGRAKADHQIISAIEHDAVWQAAPDAAILPVIDGEPDLAALVAALRLPTRAIVAVQSINSETGTILLPGLQSRLIDEVRKAGGLVLSDCSQSAGKLALPDADMVVVSAHKLGGPVGIGALLVKDFAMLEPSGGQERGYRSGTENLPGALGFAAALQCGGFDNWHTSAEDRLDFKNRLSKTGEIVSFGWHCSHIFAVSAPKLSAAALLIRLDALGFAISAGSACSSGSLKTSRTLAGLGIAPDVAARTVRVSVGWNTTVDELGAFLAAWEEVNA